MHSISAYVFRTDQPHGVTSYIPLDDDRLFGLSLYKRGMPNVFIGIYTDYFGGSGEQSVRVYSNRRYITIASETGDFFYPINAGLRLLNVHKKGNMDEFDTLGLGQFRSNEDIQDEIDRLKGK